MIPERTHRARPSLPHEMAEPFEAISQAATNEIASVPLAFA